jgi:hypothetical protein
MRIEMVEILTEEKIIDISGLGNIIPDGYTYYKKRIAPGSPLNLKGASLKWYNLYLPESVISYERIMETRDFIRSEISSGELKLENELGFVILHKAGDYLLLLITTWRNTNEMWESIYFKKEAGKDLYKPMKFESDHKGTFCVWELGIVWHERNAWVRYINSKRDSKSKLVYLNDLFSGEV